MKINTLTDECRQRMDAYWRAANYLSVGQIYFFANFPQESVHVKRQP